MTLKCNNLTLLHEFLLNKNGIKSEINNATRFSFTSGLLVDVFENGTVRFQNEMKDKSFVEVVKTHISTLNT